MTSVLSLDLSNGTSIFTIKSENKHPIALVIDIFIQNGMFSSFKSKNTCSIDFIHVIEVDDITMALQFYGKED